MHFSKSEILKKVYEQAKQFQKEGEPIKFSQLHILFGLLSLYLKNEKQVCDQPEIKESLNLLPIKPEFYYSCMAKARYLIRRKPISLEEEAAFNESYESAMLSADFRDEDVVTLPYLIQGIIEVPAPNTKQLFQFAQRVRPSHQPQISEEPLDLLSDDLPIQPQPSAPVEPEEQDLSNTIALIKRMHNKMRTRIFGQDEAIFSVVSGYFNAQVNRQEAGKPRATFLFAGAPGVGKTYLAGVAAKAMRLHFRRFDMSGFSDKEASLEFAGSDKVYRNGHEGQVTGFVRRNPKCVLLFDEIEKAHLNIIHLFLQILDAGQLKDSFTGENVRFDQAIIIMTTNAGKSLYEHLEPGAPLPGRKVILNALATEINPVTGNKFFPEAICSRFAAGNIILFNPLGAQELLHIGEATLQEYGQKFLKAFDVTLSFDSKVCAALLFAEGGQVDARALKGRASNFISTELYNWARFAYEKDEVPFSKIKEIQLAVDVGAGDPAKLFSCREKPTILLYSEEADTFSHLTASKDYQFLLPSSKQEAEKLIATEEIDLAICDIRGKEEATLNIEDIASGGRKLMDELIKERIPVFIYSSARRAINREERQAFMENGASGIFEQADSALSLQVLATLCKREHHEKMLFELGRARKVLTFDCTYDWDGNTTGIITLKNLRVIPAIEAEDQQDIAGLTATDTTFDQIIGAEDAKAELQGFISYLKEPRAYAKSGVPAPKGIILYGPPGTGKTMLAKALAHESGATFIATQGNNFLSAKNGGGAKEVKRLFAMARKYAPSVLFIDEIDIVAKNRITDGRASDVINALLNEMDGFSSHSSRPVFVLAATNFDVTYGQETALDPALLRRFDRRIYVDLPDRAERLRFIEKRLGSCNQSISPQLMENISLRSTGMSLAELESVVDFALRRMLQLEQTTLSDGLFAEAFETFCFGEKQSWNEEILQRVAIHEAGHTVISYLCGNKPTYVTVTGRSNHGGYALYARNERAQTKNLLLGEIRIALAGRAAEMLFFGEEEGLSTGAKSDLRVATEIAKEMITLFGMHEAHGLMYDEGATREETIRFCNQILSQELANAKALLQEHRSKVEQLMEALISKNHLMGQELETILLK